MMRPTFDALSELLRQPGPADLGPARRRGALDEPALRRQVSTILEGGALPARHQQLIQALLLLWHDHLESSHVLSQSLEDPDGSFVHALMHRREPDYWNAKYWWRRVGAHPAFAEIGRRAAEPLKDAGRDDLAKELLPGGRWDPHALVDACERVAAMPAEHVEAGLLRVLQQIEFEVLLERFTWTNP